MKDQPLVSVVMPVYNAEKYISKAIDSVLNQTYSNFELILINDASKDRSKEIIFSYSDPRIVYLENEINLGIAKTRNKGNEKASGSYIAVLDNDDIAMSFRFAKQVDFLEKNNGYSVCGSYYSVIDGEGKGIGKMRLPVTDKEIRTFLLFHNCFCNSSVMIRSEYLKQQLYKEGFDMIEDYYFLYSVSKISKLFNLPEYAVQYRIHGNNTSIEKLDAMRELRIKKDTIILTDLKIPFTNEELLLHSHFINGNFQYFTTSTQLSQLENWLIKLYTFLEKERVYDMRIAQRIFTSRWLLLIGRTKRVSIRFFYNKLMSTFKLKYLWFSAELLAERFSKTKSLS